MLDRLLYANVETDSRPSGSRAKPKKGQASASASIDLGIHEVLYAHLCFAVGGEPEVSRAAGGNLAHASFAPSHFFARAH